MKTIAPAEIKRETNSMVETYQQKHIYCKYGNNKI